MSAQKDWIVRHELSIDLASSGYARQMYEVDIDMEEVLKRQPIRLHHQAGEVAGRQQEPSAADELTRLWVPILRIPASEPSDQRIRKALGSDGQAVPIMPQTDVRRYMADALTWLILNAAPADIQQLSSGQQSLVRNQIRHSLQLFIRSGDHSVFEDFEKKTQIESDLWGQPLVMAGATQAVEKDEYRSGIAECIKYCRRGFFVVVGIDPDQSAPHISCELLPPELTVKRFHEVVGAHTLLGFHAGSGPRIWQAAKRVMHEPRVAYTRLTGPSRYHLRIPVPEIADFRAVHVQVTTPEDVCAEPAVLHHDQRLLTEDGRLVVQARCSGGSITPSPFEVLRSHLEQRQLTLSSPAAGELVAAELRDISREWAFRANRLEAVEHLPGLRQPNRLSVMRRRCSGWLRQKARQFIAIVRRRPQEWPEVPAARTKLRRDALTLASLAGKLADEAIDLADVLRKANDEDRGRERSALRQHIVSGVNVLAEIENGIAHVEMTGDDDHREHVAHFHVDSTRTVHQRTTDSRPVVNAIVRPSRHGRKDYIWTAILSCLTSTALLAGLFGVVQIAPSRIPNAEALVALLLLVPGLSVSRLGRIPGETMRHLVLGRAQRLATVSLVPPVISAAITATVFGGSDPADQQGIDMPMLRWDLSVQSLFGVMAIASAVITGLVVRDYLRAGRSFDHDSTVLGLITYQEDQNTALEPADEDEAVRAAVNSDRIAELTKSALFQIDRPSQRFMVWVVLNEDRGNVFSKVLDVLETLPRRLTEEAAKPTQDLGDGQRVQSGGRIAQLTRQVVRVLQEEQAAASAKAEAEAGNGIPVLVPAERRDPTIIESSLVMSVATTGITMSIVSHDLDSEAQGSIDEQHITAILRKELAGTVEDFDIAVQEIDDDTQLFRHRAFRYEHYSFVGQSDKSCRRKLIDELLRHESPTRRISYLYCPVMAHSPGGAPLENDASIRVGFAIHRDVASPEDHLRLLLTDAAAIAHYDVKTDKRLADDPGSGVGYDWPKAGDLEPFVLLSAGPDSHQGLQKAFEWLNPSDSFLFEGGTVLTNGGYSCRTLRFWASRNHVAELKAHLKTSADMDAVVGGVQLEQGMSEQTESEKGEPTQGESQQVEQAELELRADVVDAQTRTHWKLRPSGTEDPLAGGESADPEWMISWIRWRLEVGSDGVRYLLSVLERWAELTATQDRWEATFTNIEFLATRLHGRALVSGKARYRIGIEVKEPSLRASDVKDEVNRSLESALRAGLASLLTGADRFVVVEASDPSNPLTVLGDRP